jgi:hypothetical protein
MSNEQRVRRYASHLAFTIRRRGTRLELRETNYFDLPGKQHMRVLGTFRSFAAIERWLEDVWSPREIRRLNRQIKQGRE